ncbi:MAG: endonuclease/exonuclease/phosphatase family protein [Myxococcota bacterium]
MGWMIGAGLVLAWGLAVAHPVELVATALNAAFGPLLLVSLLAAALSWRAGLRRGGWGFGAVAALYVATAGLRVGSMARPGRAEGPEITVVSYNVLFEGGDPDVTVRLLADQNADVWFLQEVTPAWAAAIVDLAPHRVVADRKGTQGLAVLSRYPLSRPRLWHDEDGRIVGQCVDAMIEGSPHGLCHLHLASPSWAIVTSDGPLQRLSRLEDNARRRARQWRRLEAEMQEHYATRIIAGDFNTLPTESFLRDARRRWVDATRSRAWIRAGATWPQVAAIRHRPPWLLGQLAAGGPWFRIDYLLCDPSVAVRDAQRRHGGGSDHLPVRATLALPAGVTSPRSEGRPTSR